MEENKEELSIEEMFDRLDGIMRTLEDSRSTLVKPLHYLFAVILRRKQYITACT